MPSRADDVQRKKKSREGQSRAVVPFAASAHRRQERFIDISFTPGAATQFLGSFEVPSFGYLRSVWLWVEMTGGVAGTVDEDGPYNAVIGSLIDPGGIPLVNSMTGYELFLANLFGGYKFVQDPRSYPDAVLTAPNSRFTLRFPVEIHANDGLGSVPNQNSAAPLRVNLTGNTSAEIWSALPSTIPQVRIRGVAEGWTLPDRQSPSGDLQAQVPPMYGTTQFWSSVGPKTMSAGDSQIPITKIGNYIRTLIFLCRAAGVRSLVPFPDNPSLSLDTYPLEQDFESYRRDRMGAEYIYTAAGVPAGVIAYGFDHDVLGHGGDGTGELWLPTTQASRFELAGTFGAGDVTVLINEVAPIEVEPEMAYVEGRTTGRLTHPAVTA